MNVKVIIMILPTGIIVSFAVVTGSSSSTLLVARVVIASRHFSRMIWDGNKGIFQGGQFLYTSWTIGMEIGSSDTFLFPLFPKNKGDGTIIVNSPTSRHHCHKPTPEPPCCQKSCFTTSLNISPSNPNPQNAKYQIFTMNIPHKTSARCPWSVASYDESACLFFSKTCGFGYWLV